MKPVAVDLTYRDRRWGPFVATFVAMSERSARQRAFQFVAENGVPGQFFKIAPNGA